MGAGAGYNIRGTIDFNSIKINSFKVEEPYFESEEVTKGNYIDWQYIHIDCDIDCAVDNISSESYYYGGTLHGLTPIKITHMSLTPKHDDIEDISEIDESVIIDALYDLKFDCSIGGGWSHSKFDGNISCGIDDLEESDYSDFYLDGIGMFITNKDAIEVLDKYATGDNYEERYSVVDIDNNIISDDFYGDELKYAIDYAEENNGYQVESEKIWYSYEISDSGEIDIWDEDVDYDNVSIEWTNPNYIDEDF